MMQLLKIDIFSPICNNNNYVAKPDSYMLKTFSDRVFSHLHRIKISKICNYEKTEFSPITGTNDF